MDRDALRRDGYTKVRDRLWHKENDVVEVPVVPNPVSLNGPVWSVEPLVDEFLIDAAPVIAQPSDFVYVQTPIWGGWR